LGEYGKVHFPNEFGGFLVGYYSDDLMKLFITDCLMPVKYKGQRFIFERRIDGLRKAFKKLFDAKKQYYIGEWHTHPGGSSEFSQIDLDAMREISGCQTVRIMNPILLILSIDGEGVRDYAFYLYCDGELIKYEKS
jgi:proteasome lid subunit RPN8/RPN11